MTNDESSTWNGIYNAESFSNFQMLDDQDWYYNCLERRGPGTQPSLPFFDTLPLAPLTDSDQVYVSTGYHLPPLNNSHEYHISQTLSDFSVTHATSGDVEASPFSDIRLSTLQPEGLEICFGMIRGIRIRFIDDEKYLFVTAILSTNPYICVCSLLFISDRCKLKTSGDDSRVVATLSNKDFKQLEKLRNDLNLRLDGIFSQQQLDDMNKTLVTSVDINVYGVQSQADEVADALATAGYFLQDPIWKPEDIDYDNPQLLELPQFDDTVLLAEAQTDQTLFSSTLPRQCVKYINSNGIDFDRILDDFARQDYLSPAVVDNRIQTDLLPYQRQGVDFILRRESALATPEHNLWDLEYGDDADEVIYRHSITGATSEAPRQTLGGILADEMGLGKSLTMLSAIMASSSDAGFYVQSKMSDYLDSDQNIIRAKSTLLIVPSALLIDNWVAEIEKHVYPGNISYYKYHGYHRKIQRSELVQHDIVLTTYGTVTVELSKPQKLLFGIDWYRIVLDEAHIIRNPSTHNFKAVYSLRSLIRWCMSGTPIQNKIDDLATQIRFLRMPFLEEPPQFRRHISHKIQLTKEGSTSDFKNLRSLLRSICLRRNKTVLPMSSYKEETCEVSLNAQEQAEYQRLKNLCLEAHEMKISGRAIQHSHSTILRIILRLRLLCNNGPTKKPAKAPFLLQDSDEIFALLQQDGLATCYFCRRDVFSVPSSQDPESAQITSCSISNLVCFDCLDVYKLGWEMGLCPICKAEHKESPTPSNASESMADRDMPDASIITSISYPTKLVKLCENIKEDINHHKSIVFSFWKKTLDIVCDMFEEQRIPYLRLDGNVPYARRKDIISDFQQSKEGTILLMTLSIGAMGLNNLSVASHVHILEPQWNPQVEAQAIGRVIRLGQERSVRIVRYLVKGTVEKSIRDRQIQKLRLSRAGVHDDGTDENGYPTTVLLQDLIHPSESENQSQPAFSI